VAHDPDAPGDESDTITIQNAEGPPRLSGVTGRDGFKLLRRAVRRFRVG
jgi:hypothetical protein